MPPRLVAACRTGGADTRSGTGPDGAMCGDCRHHVPMMARGWHSGVLQPTGRHRCAQTLSPNRRPVAVPHRTPACRLWQPKERT